MPKPDIPRNLRLSRKQHYKESRTHVMVCGNTWRLGDSFLQKVGNGISVLEWDRPTGSKRRKDMLRTHSRHTMTDSYGMLVSSHHFSRSDRVYQKKQGELSTSRVSSFQSFKDSADHQQSPVVLGHPEGNPMQPHWRSSRD